MHTTLFLLGSRCLLCSEATHSYSTICTYCYNNLPKLPQSCRICAEFLPGFHHLDLICGDCQATNPPYEKIHAAHPYEFPIIQLVTQLKFLHKRTAARTLADIFIQATLDKPLPDIIIPIPLHPQRLKERGFNQSALIAKYIGRRLDIPLDTTSVKRIKQTAPQSQLNAIERRSNIKDAFIATQRFDGKHIAILDDVVTTGETVRECAKALKAQGAKKITIWCVARRG